MNSNKIYEFNLLFIYFLNKNSPTLLRVSNILKQQVLMLTLNSLSFVYPYFQIFFL